MRGFFLPSHITLNLNVSSNYYLRSTQTSNMKRHILLLAIIIGLVIESQAGFGVGGHIGMNFQSYKTNQENVSTDLNSKVGFHIGANVRVGGKTYTKVGFSWMQTQTKLNDSTLVENLKVNSFQVPVLVGYKVVDNEGFKLRIELGPYFNFAHKTKVSGNLIDEDNYNNFNTGLRFGGGIDILFITIDGFYDLGLTNAFKIPNTGSKQRGWGIEAGVFFEIGG